MPLSRRNLLRGTGGLTVAFSLPGVAAASPATLAADSVDGYLAVAPDGSVTEMCIRDSVWSACAMVAWPANWRARISRMQR